MDIDLIDMIENVQDKNKEIDVPNQVQKLIQALLGNHHKRNGMLDNNATKIGYDVLPGNKYLKIVCGYKTDTPGELEQTSVHAFVDKKNGDLYKATSWKAPAKGVRFNLFTDIDVLTQLADTHGGYLYQGSRCSEAAKAVGDVGSYANTGKTLTDHAISKYTGKDCKTINILEDKEICEEVNAVDK